MARERLDRLSRARASKRGPSECSLLEYVHRTSPELDPPNHLAPVAEALERSLREPVFLCFSVPPQHGKSTLVFHFIAKVLSRLKRDIIYLTYNDDFASTQARIARRIAERGGVRFASGSTSIGEWQTAMGGTFFAGGISGGVTGRPGGIVIVDDPIKNWPEAQSATIRDRIDFDFRTSILTRLHPDSSVVVVHTRWHVDDTIGRLDQEGWQYINLPAINDDGEALWPERRPVAFLEKQREKQTDLLFSALYQGRPVPIGGEVFKAPALCTVAQLPVMGSQWGIGTDLAYSVKTKADYSVRVDAQRNGEIIYVSHVERRQVAAPEFAFTLKAAAAMYPGAPIYWHAAGVEKGAADFLITQGVPLTVVPATTDKFIRAQETAALWNSGKIVVPSDAPWSQTFIRELMQFTGRGDAHDDQVDALVSAVAALTCNVTGKVTTTRPRATGGLRGAY